MNKTGALAKKGAMFIMIVLMLLSIIMFTNKVFAAKADQYFVGTYTCEHFTDSVLWSAAASKTVGTVTAYYNWTPGTSCKGTRDCDMIRMSVYSRFINAGSKDPALAGWGYTQIANTTQSSANPVTWTRYASYLNGTLPAGTIENPKWECGNEPPASQTPNVCNTSKRGYNVSDFNYTIRAYGEDDRGFATVITDNFYVNYTWCWTPLIYDANVTPDSGPWGSNFTFTIRVNDPTDTVNVSLWKKQVSDTDWQQVSGFKECINCGTEHEDILNWTVTFQCSEIGEWMFKFNASDKDGHKAEASASSTTIECVDIGSDCKFELERDRVNISYGGGNDSTATQGGPAATLVLQTYDTDRDNRTNISEDLYVKFNVTTSWGGSFKTMGSNDTLQNGTVRFSFVPDGSFSEGTSLWMGYVDTTTSTCYEYNESKENYTVNVLLAAAENTNPNVYNETVNGQTAGVTAGWGEVWNFSVKVNDSDGYGDDLNISLQLDTGSGYIAVENKSCFSCNVTTQINFTINFTCSDIETAAKYKFVVTDNASTPGSTTTTEHTFTIERDDVEILHLRGNDSIANRSGNQFTTLILAINDTDNATLVGSGVNITFKITTDGSLYDSGFVNGTTITGNATYYFNASCTPTNYEAKHQKWTGQTIDDTCYKDVTSEIFNLTIRGDIQLKLDEPTGTANFTQEDTLSFLGSTTNDCGDPLVTNITYLANTTGETLPCKSISTIGANAFRCYFDTNISTTRGWYNTSMHANASFYYDNYTYKNATPGLFYLDPIKKLDDPTADPTVGGWGRPHWNFSVTASSGDPDTLLNVSLFMQKNTPNPTVNCEDVAACSNQTNSTCLNCIDDIKFWFRNFTYEDKGWWYYQFKFDDADTTSTSGTAYKVNVTKDATNITYGGQGQGVTVVYHTNPVNLTVRVFDKDRATFNLSPSAVVTFRLVEEGTDIGNATTNETGYATFWYNLTDCSITEGAQNWIAYINVTDDSYNSSNSSNIAITLDASGCTTNVAVDEVLAPEEVFQHRLFVVNASVTSYLGTSANVSVWINASHVWNVTNRTQFIGDVAQGQIKSVSWEINATTYGAFNISVYVNSSNAGTDNTSASPQFLTVYRVDNPSPVDSPSLPALINASGNFTTGIACEQGVYRQASLRVNLNTSGTKIRVFSYYDNRFVELMHGFKLGKNNVSTKFEIPVLQKQLDANESGYCVFRIENIGVYDINVSSITFEAYFNDTVAVRDIQPYIYGRNTTGLEPSEGMFNVTVFVANSFNDSYTINVTLNITNSSYGVVNDSTKLNVVLTKNSTINVTFLDINTSGWKEDDYIMKATAVGGFGTDVSRTETLVFRYVNISATSVKYICNKTTEEFDVTIIHPFNDTILYNITLQLPVGWSHDGNKSVNISKASNQTITFNLTSGNSAGQNVSINVSVNFTYPPGLNKSRWTNHSMESGNAVAVLEIIRETPTIVDTDRVFESQLTIHNKGCAATTNNATVKEQLSTGWTPANPSIKTNSEGTDVTLTDSDTNLETNVITWTVDTIEADKYAVLTYQIKSPTSVSTLGSLKANVTWEGNKSVVESVGHALQTYNYSSESHLEFDIDVLQKSEYPQAEPRSARFNVTYNYSLEVTNIGDMTASSDWNITLDIPSACNVTKVFNNGTYNETKRIVVWNLSTDLAVRDATVLNFSMICDERGGYTLVAKAIKDNRTRKSFLNATSITCSESSCPAPTLYNFVKPSNMRYAEMESINFNISYRWDGANMTLGQGFVNMSDDHGNSRLVWQNFSFVNATSTLWANYTLDSDERYQFRKSSQRIYVSSQIDATDREKGNVSINNIDYTWYDGKVFEEPQNLFIKIKVYTYAPLLRNPRLFISGTQWNSSSSSFNRTGGWGEEFNFTVEVQERFNRSVNVFLWHKKGTGSYTLIENKTCYDCPVYTRMNFTFNYDGDNISDTDGWTFKFNASDVDGNTEQAGFTYTVEKDDVHVNVTAPPNNDAIINRSDNTTFSVRIYDIDNQTYPNGSAQGSGRIYITIYDIDTYESSPDLISANDGFLNRTMANVDWCADISQYYLGNHSWYGGVSSHSYIKDNTTSPLNFTLIGNLSNDLATPNGTVNITRGENMQFKASVTDDCGTSRTGGSTILFTLSRGSFEKNCTANSDGICYIQTGSTFPLGFYNVTIVSNRTWHNNRSFTNVSLFFLGTVPKLDDPRKAPTAIVVPWGNSPLNFSVNITDYDNDTVITQLWIKNSSVEFYNESTYNCTRCNNHEYKTEINFSYWNANANPWEFKFNSTDSSSIGINETATFTFNITKDAVDIRDMGGNNSIVNRTHIINLSVVVYDLIMGNNTMDADTPNVSLTEITFYVYNGSDYVENATAEDENGSTNFLRTFNPGCNYLAGNQTWYVVVNNSDAYITNKSTEVKVQIYGTINVSYNSPVADYEYERGVVINLTSSLTDECGRNVTLANVTYLVKTTGRNYTCGPVSNATSVYPCSFDTTGKNIGSYNVTVNGYKAFHYNGTDDNASAFKIKSTPRLKNASVNIESDGWSLRRSFYVNVTDNTGDNVTVSAWHNLGSGWVRIGTQNCTSCSNSELVFNYTYACGDIGDDHEFMFNATDTEGNFDNTTIAGNDYLAGSDDKFDITKDEVIVYTVAGNLSNATLERPVLFIVRVYDTDNNTFALRENATVSFNVTKTGIFGSYTTAGSATTNASGHAAFNFTPDRSYNTTKQVWKAFTGSQSCYLFNETSEANITTHTNVPLLITESVYPITAGWGADRFFNVTVIDNHNNGTVYLYKSTVVGGPFTFVDQQDYNFTNRSVNISFAINFTGDDRGTLFYYMFNASNTQGNKNRTAQITTNNFTVTKDNLTIEALVGNNSVANRTDSQIRTLSLIVKDIDNRTNASGVNVTFAITFDGSSSISFSNLTNSSGGIEYDFDPVCSPSKYRVGLQTWRVDISNEDDYNDYSLTGLNISIKGDIILTFNEPTGTENFTQEGTIGFLGSTTDDCGDALVTNVTYYANTTGFGFTCTNISTIGANAFRCYYITNITTTRGWYNVTMFANATHHHENNTERKAAPGLFYLDPVKNLDDPTAVPTTGGWGRPHWNFSVTVSSGDPDRLLNLSLYMDKATPNPTTNCEDVAACTNITNNTCQNCINDVKFWLRNFTYNDQGRWYYQFKLDDPDTTSTSGTTNYVDVEKDATNISYGDAGDGVTVTYHTNPVNLTVRVFDKDRATYNLSPSAVVTFRLKGEGENIGNATTNATGYATFWYNLTDCSVTEGSQNWIGYINSSEENYNESNSTDFTITIDATGCTVNVNIDDVIAPSEAFQYRTFIVNASVTSYLGTSANVSAWINVTPDWNVTNRTQFLGDIALGAFKSVSWAINASTAGSFNISIYVNSSNAGTYNTSNTPQFITVYEAIAPTKASETIPVVIEGDNETVVSWGCNASTYRTASLDITLNTSGTTIRVHSYDGWVWKDILHSHYINTNLTAKTISVPVLKSQIFPNGSGYCLMKVENIGTTNITLKNATLEAYYEPETRIQDIAAKVNTRETTGIEPGEKFFNISVKIDNDLTSTQTLNITLNITNSSNGVVNDSTLLNVDISANSNVTKNFTNINTSGWAEGDYNITVYISGEQSDSRTEGFVFRYIEVTGKSDPYMCNGTTEDFDVTVVHPFDYAITYNITLDLPSGWTYTEAKNLTAIQKTNYTVKFNVTSGQINQTGKINVSINYSYLGINKANKSNSVTIENNHSIPILEVIRESPSEVAPSTEIYSRLIIYNKGCAQASSVSFREKYATGWTGYEPTLDGSSAGSAAIPSRELRFTSTDIGTIDETEYTIVKYKLLSPSTSSTRGTLRYNLTWGSRTEYEDTEFEINTTAYSSESHLSFDLLAAGSWNDRSADPAANQSYNLTVTNIGDLKINLTTWNVTLDIPQNCTVTSAINGSWNAQKRVVVWVLNKSLAAGADAVLMFDMNCTVARRNVLTAWGINDTRNTTTFTNNTAIGCKGADCTDTTAFTFRKPSSARYEKMDQIDFYVDYNWSGYGLTIGEGSVNITDDYGISRIAWQNRSFNLSDGKMWINYSIDDSDQGNFQNSTRNIAVKSYTDAVANGDGNVTVSQIRYKWDQGRLFRDNNQLFLNIKLYVFTPDAPTLSSPTNNSGVYSTPVVLSWTAVSGSNVSYYVYGDSTNGTTYLGATSDNYYLWRGIDSGIYYWRVKSTTLNGVRNSTYSETRLFNLDLCARNTDYAYALSYPMSYDNATDTITVYSSNSSDGKIEMGQNETNATTFQHIFEFANAVRGTCAMTNPASGSYAVLSNLNLGNASSEFNKTFVRTYSESVDFSKQLKLNPNSTLVSGLLTDVGSPYSGSTLSFSGVSNITAGEGLLYTLTDSYLKLYDSFLIHKVTPNQSNLRPWSLYWNGSVISERSSFEGWWTIRFLNSNNTLDDIVLTNIGEGFYPGTTQVGTLSTIKSRKTDDDGVYFHNNANVTITSLEISETGGTDIRVVNYTGIANLLNPTLNWSSINWTEGSYSGRINRRYTYDVTITDSAGAAIENTSLKMVDVRGDNIFSLLTDTDGEVPQQTITRSIFDYSYKSGDDQGPHTLYIKKYGKTFQEVVKSFAAATVETTQMTDNPFTTLSEAAAKAQANITFNPPKVVSYGGENNASVTTSMTLQNSPVTQSEFFGIFANGTKLVEGANYTINYETGVITFNETMAGYNISPVYSYGGNITISNGVANLSMSNIYDFMQANLSDVLTTVDGTAYTVYVDLVIGNDSATGSIVDSDASLTFEDGYNYMFRGLGGFIDLYGVTEGGGTSGGLPLNIRDAVGGPFNPGDRVDIFSFTFDSDGTPVTSTVNITIFYPNGTTLVSNLSNQVETGFFKFNTTLSSDTPLGTYGVKIDATYSGDEVHDTLVFRVESASSSGSSTGGLPLNIFNTVGTIYDTGELVRVFSTVVNSSGGLVNATVNVSVYRPNGTLMEEGGSVLVSAGRFEYNFTTPQIEGTYRVDIDANYSGNEVHDTEAFIVSIGGVGGNNGSFVPQVQVEAPAVINTDTAFSITALTTNNNGVATDCSGGANLTIRNTINSTEVINDAVMNKFGTGLYNYSYTVGTQATYMAMVECTISNVNYVGIKEFSTQDVAGTGGSSGSVGGLPLNIFSDTGAFYSPGDELVVFAITTNSSGALVSANVNVSVYYPNTTLINRSFATAQSTGVFRYNYTLPSTAPTGTYQVKLDANYSGNEIHDVLAFIISPVLEDIANIVNNINTTINTINDKIDVINTTINNIESTVNTINSTVSYINSTVTNINSTINNIRSTINNINSTVNNIDSTVNRINSTVNNIDSNITLINTLVTNINATVTSINSTIVYINTTVENINSIIKEINSTIILINSTVTNINEYTSDSFTIRVSDFGEVSADDDFLMKVWVFNASTGAPMDADSLPTIELIDPTRNPPIGPYTMSKVETGVYDFNYTTSSSQTDGVWEAVVTVIVNGITTNYSDYWELESSPAEVKINEITDRVIPTITADVTITNEGSGNQEYHYEYCIVAEQTNACGGGDDVDYASDSKLLTPGESYNPLLTLDDVSSTGWYYFKIVVRYGSERSGASEYFEAIAEAVTPEEPAPSADAGAGGGGGGAGRPRKIFDFELDKDIIKVAARQGETVEKELTVSNTGNQPLTIEIDLSELTEFISLPGEVDRYGFDLSAGENKTVELVFKFPKDIEPGDFFRDILVKGNSKGKTVRVFIEIESEAPLFDVDVEVLPEYEWVYPGDEVLAEITLYNLKGIGKAEVDMQYFISDMNGTLLVSEEETLFVEKQRSFVRNLKLSKNTNPGDYIFNTKATYNGYIGRGSDLFEVKEKPGIIPKRILELERSNMLLIILLILLLTIILLYFQRKKRKEKKEKRKGKATTKKIKKKVYIPKKLVKEAEEKEPAAREKLEKSLKALEEAFESGYISEDSYKKDKSKIEKLLNNVRKRKD